MLAGNTTLSWFPGLMIWNCWSMFKIAAMAMMTISGRRPNLRSLCRSSLVCLGWICHRGRSHQDQVGNIVISILWRFLLEIKHKHGLIDFQVHGGHHSCPLHHLRHSRRHPHSHPDSGALWPAATPVVLPLFRNNKLHPTFQLHPTNAQA